MALSMDEQRVLAEIERRLAADDPGLATCLTSFRRPGPATVLRSPRARIIGSLFGSDWRPRRRFTPGRSSCAMPGAR